MVLLRNNPRFDLLRSLEIFCKISNNELDICLVMNKTADRERFEHFPPILCRPSLVGISFVYVRNSTRYGFLTLQNNPPMLDKTAHHFQGLCSGGPSFIQSESIQPLQDGLNFILPKNFLHEFPCDELESNIRISDDKTHLVVLP